MSTRPRLVLRRNYVMTSSFGHSIEFIKDVPTHVPDFIYHEALAIGAQTEDGTTVDMIGEPTSDKTPNDPVERSRLITMAIEDIVERNERREFTAAGSPSVKAVERAVGFDVDAREIQTLWQKYHDDKAG